MSSRQEEKERRRQERLALEQQEAGAAARRRRLGIVFGTILAVAAVAAIVVVAASSGGGGGGGGDGDKGGPGDLDVKAVPIPPQRTANLTAAAKAAGCEVRDLPNYGRDHTEEPVTYKSNPPTSGAHNPVPASDGTYPKGETPDAGHLVHALEHGRIQFQYKPGTPVAQVGRLLSLFEEREAYVLLYENATGMKYAVAATAWRHLLGCPRFNDNVWDALRAFRDEYTLKAPEVIAQKE